MVRPQGVRERALSDNVWEEVEGVALGQTSTKVSLLIFIPISLFKLRE